MLEKGIGIDKDEFVEILMQKKDKGSDCILRTMKGNCYGRIISVGFDRVSINQEGKVQTVEIDDILEVE